MGAFPGPTVPAWMASRLDRGLGSICLFGSNIVTPDQLASLTAQLHTVAPDVLIATDEEGGDVTRLHLREGSPHPGNAALGVVDDVALTEAVARSIGLELFAAGVDLNTAPVVDVNSNPANPVIGVRSFGADPSLVARHARAYVTGLQSAGVGACVKHFPGHGDTAIDSHLDLPTVVAPLDVLRRRELAPFATAVAAGTLAVMTSHVLLPAIDQSLPATLSPSVLKLLRDDLGFDGLVENGYDAIVSRDDVTELAAAVAMLMTTLSRLCEDLWMWSTLEFGYVELADRYCSVSSIMPQKKNPGVLEKIKALSAQAIGDAMAAFAAVKNVSFSECGDAQAGGNAPLHNALDAAIISLDLGCGFLPSMTVKAARLRHLAAIGYATMTELADTIVREKGMSFRMAHNIVGKTVSRGVDAGLTAVDLTTELLDESSQELFGHPLGLSAEALQKALDPWENIRVRTVTGGPAPVEMARMLGNARARLSAAEARQADRRARIADARQHLAEAVEAV